MKVVIVGGVAGGASAAARIRRLDLFLVTNMENRIMAIIMPMVPPWLARPPSHVYNISMGCCE